MVRSKGKKKPQKEMREKDLIEIVEEEVTFMCPKRGLVKQKVKVKRFKTSATSQPEVIKSNDATSVIDKLDDGLDLYLEPEEIEE